MKTTLFPTLALLLGSFSVARADVLPTASLPNATKTPKVGKVGQKMAVAIAPKESQDFNLDLPKGSFLVYVDTQGIGEDHPHTDFSVYLLKRNGAAMPGYGGHLIYDNTRERTERVSKAFSLAKPTGVRFRIKNEATEATNYWLTVVPASPVKFLPFGFGSKIMAAKIGNSDGTGGPLDALEFHYLRATIPAGKWSISLGAKAETGCDVSVDCLEASGIFNYSAHGFHINDVGNEQRQEKILTFIKPTTLLFRVVNNAIGTPASYDLTIEKSTD